MNQGNSEPEADNIDLKFLSSIEKKKNSDITGDSYMALAESAHYNLAYHTFLAAFREFPLYLN